MGNTAREHDQSPSCPERSMPRVCCSSAKPIARPVWVTVQESQAKSAGRAGGLMMTLVRDGSAFVLGEPFSWIALGRALPVFWNIYLEVKGQVSESFMVTANQVTTRLEKSIIDLCVF